MDLARVTTDAVGAWDFSQGAVEVDVDLSFIVQVALFVVLLLVLKPVLFEPMLKLFEERERRIDGAKVQARHIDDQSAGALSKYEAAMAKARAEANAEREKIRTEGVRIENEILNRVRQETGRVLEDGKRRAQDEAARVRETLKAEAQALAKELAGRVLGREVQP